MGTTCLPDSGAGAAARAAAVERLGEENKKLREECERARSLRGDLAAAEAAKKKAEADLAEARAAAESAKSALERVENGSAPAEGGAEELKRLLDAANARADAAEAKAAAAEEALAAKSEETDAFVSEVEEVGAAYEESQSETARLMQRLTERDGTEAKAIQDANAANNQCRRLRDELAGAEAAVAHERGVAQAAAQRCRDAEAARAEQTAELQRARDEAAQLAERMEEPELRERPGREIVFDARNTHMAYVAGKKKPCMKTARQILYMEVELPTETQTTIAAMEAMESELVLEARRQSAFTCSSRAAKTFFLMSRFSTMASITNPQLANDL